MSSHSLFEEEISHYTFSVASVSLAVSVAAAQPNNTEGTLSSERGLPLPVSSSLSSSFTSSSDGSLVLPNLLDVSETVEQVERVERVERLERQPTVDFENHTCR